MKKVIASTFNALDKLWSGNPPPRGVSTFDLKIFNQAFARADVKEVTRLLKKNNPAQLIELTRCINTGRSVLHRAAQKGQRRLLETLLDFGGRLDDRDYAQATPLHVAAASNHKGVVDCLISRGADIDAEVDDGRTALAIAIGGQHKTIAAALEKESIRRRDEAFGLSRDITVKRLRFKHKKPGAHP